MFLLKGSLPQMKSAAAFWRSGIVACPKTQRDAMIADHQQELDSVRKLGLPKS